MTKAQLFHSIADELGCDPELVGATATELKLRKRVDIEAAVRARLSESGATAPIDDSSQTAQNGQAEPDAPKAKKPAAPGLTLSQRRALLRLLDGGEDGFTPATPFKALPYIYATEVGYAVAIEHEETLDEVVTTYHLTHEGRVRAESVNPKYRDWSAGETVANDESRPTAGTHRARREAERRAAEDAARQAAVAETVSDFPVDPETAESEQVEIAA